MIAHFYDRYNGKMDFFLAVKMNYNLSKLAMIFMKQFWAII